MTIEVYTSIRIILKGANRVRAILIDADSQALNILKNQLSIVSDIDIIGMYDDVHLGKEAVKKESIDVVFLETLLPNQSGIALAKQFKQFQPKVKIIFVTAHEQYALDAYNLNAVDYIIKPVRRERLQQTINRLDRKKIKSSSST